jgi:2-polyprenyl-3-methyl-5-hydroxy-6-metoxy-1,4-benzoquinol methylase
VTDQVALGRSAAFYDDKAEVYREVRAPELLRAVRSVLPVGGRALDVGAGSGRLLGLLADQAGYRVGIELSPQAAELAREFADEIVVGDVMTDSVSLPAQSFDVIVCGDVLEHLPDPHLALQKIVGWLAPRGAVVISVPNIAYFQSRARLVRGVWRYESWGIWDSGHLRFFTQSTLYEMMSRAGLRVDQLVTTIAPDGYFSVLRSAPTPIRREAARIFRQLAQRRPSLFAYQLIAVGRPTSSG